MPKLNEIATQNRSVLNYLDIHDLARFYQLNKSCKALLTPTDHDDFKLTDLLASYSAPEYAVLSQPEIEGHIRRVELSSLSFPVVMSTALDLLRAARNKPVEEVKSEKSQADIEESK